MRLKQQGENPTKKRGRVVVDTGVLVSAFAFGGIPEKAVKKAFGGSEVYVSPPLLRGYRNVPLALRDEEKIDFPQLKALISGIASYVARAKVINPNVSGYPTEVSALAVLK